MDNDTTTLTDNLREWTIGRLLEIIPEESNRPELQLEIAKSLVTLLETPVGTEMTIEHPALAAVEWAGETLDNLDWTEH